jgi:hypothetical protein
MEDLNLNICKVLQEITDYNIESVTEMDQGFLLANILAKIDNDEFSAKDKTLNNWNAAKDRLEHFLALKGLANQNLDFELPEIRKGEAQAIISALLQILAILAAFNPSNWDRLIGSVDYMAKITLTKFLESMIADIKEEIKFSRRASKSIHFENPDDIKSILQKLEKHENTIEIHEQTIQALRIELTKENQEKAKLQKTLEERNKEILEMQQIKTEALKLLESNYSSRREDQNGEDLGKKVSKLNHEIDNLNEKLLEARSIIIDKDNEIDKLKLMHSFLEEKKTELEEINDQLIYYKKLTDSLKKEKEISESKLKCFELADKTITRLKDLLNEEKQTSSALKLKVIELEQTITSLQRKLGNTEDKVVILRRSMSINTNNNESGDIFMQGTYVRDLEDENSKLKQNIKELLTHQNEVEMKKFEEELKDKETEMMRSKLKTLLIENENLTIQKTHKKERIARSMASIDPTDIHFNDILNNLKENESIVFQNVRTGDLSWEKEDEELKAYATSFNFEDFSLMYTALMSYTHKDLLKARLLVPGRGQRNRDIFKPFAIHNLFLPSKESFQ